MPRGLFALVAASVVLSVGLAAPAAEITLKGGVAVPPNTSIAAPFQRFVDKVNADGKGILQIRLLGPEAVPGAEQGNAIKSGVLDIAAIPPSYYKGLMVEGDVLVLSDLTFAEQRKAGAYDYLNKLHNQKVNAEFLTAYGEHSPFHIYLNKPVAKPDDFKGIKLRSLAIYQDFFTALGATPVSVAATEVYTALERGIVDGYGWPAWGIEDLGWQKYTKYRVDPGFFTVLMNIIVNQDKWKEMTAEQRDFLKKTSTWFDQDYQVWAKAKSADEKAKQEKLGIKAIDLGPGFRQKAHDIYWASLEKASPEHVPVLKRMLSKTQ